MRAIARGRGVVAAAARRSLAPRADRADGRRRDLGRRARRRRRGGGVRRHAAIEPWLALLAGGSFLCLIGAIDDRRNLKPATKVVVQLIAAALAVGAGYQIRFFHQITTRS